ncbi:type II inositol 3,4-bisphosphate 4-phosphatase isoform X3 [Electrophorus electricus]|uniref:type II inositol 3,4-bisphosphate 4-phosphatase isoform X3 n=1 Tax=Electrophorus electricus TaxID=8005 RepID=UPI0015D068D9|nr:type II inositol 3,4-bisphosphate 4-phosphatase isoform X3 [Electrophorus electricus]
MEADSLAGKGAGPKTHTSVILKPRIPQLEFCLACRELESEFRDRKPNTLVQVAILDAHAHETIACACTEMVEGTRDPVFLTGVSLSPDWPICEESQIKLSVYDVKGDSQRTSSFLGSASFSVAELLKSKDQQLALSLRTSDDSASVGTVVVCRLKMGEVEDVEVEHVTADAHQKCTLVCESSHGTTNDKDSEPLLNEVFKSPVCKMYRFQTVDGAWLLVREQMSECALSFSLPRQLLNLFIQEDGCRVQELKDLGELSPHWDNLRTGVLTRYGQVIKAYQDTLAELEKHTGPSFKPSCSKGQKYLEFVPINLHTQRMRVTGPSKTDAVYDVITVGAPAAHHQGFKGGGLQRLLSRYEVEKKSYSTAYQCIYYPPEHTAKARDILSTVSQLQPLIGGLADHLLLTAQQHSAHGLRDALKSLALKTEQFVHALKDELVKSALLALHAARPGYVSKSHTSCPAMVDSTPSPAATPAVTPAVTPAPAESLNQSPESDTAVCNSVSASPGTEGGSVKHQDIPHHTEYDEEEWDRVWASVAKNLNRVMDVVDQLRRQDNTTQRPAVEQTLADVITSHSPAAEWSEQLCPLVAALKNCVNEVAERASKSMAFVLLQEAACSSPHGLQLQRRRDTVFSQALVALACGFIVRLYSGMEDTGFLQQLHSVGLVAQFESLLSTYSEEVGMLEDMEVAVSDLQKVTFRITEAPSDDPSKLQPTVSGRRDHYTVDVPLPVQAFQTLPEELRKGKLLHVVPVLFNVGINEQQTFAERFGDISLQERINQRNFDILQAYYKSLRDKVPLESLPCFQTQTDVKELLETLGQNVVTKKRKNVEILWLAGAICRRLNGIRFTSCKSAKDRTSMSVTLEQCALLRDEHQLRKDYFTRALDCMRREGCRIENVQKNIKCRKYAFNMLQLMAFPKSYRPPEGTYGKVDS